MGSYRETSEEPESFYVDTFGAGQQLEIIEVIRGIGGQVEYNREAHHMGEARARYRITLPAGCEHAGLDEYMAPQTITLPGGDDMRKLCVYPQDESVHLAWLPGDSAHSEMWDGAKRKPEYTTAPDKEEIPEPVPSTKRPNDVTLSHLELDCQQIPGSVDRFITLLRAFVADPGSDVTGLRVYNLQEMAKSLRMNFERIEGLLGIIDQRQQEQREH
jgi:hypothetical protein